MSAWLYVVQTPEAAKTDPAVFKIGKTAQGPRARFGNYPKGTTLHFQTSVGDPDEAERLVLVALRASPEKFQPVPSMGREYFRCDLGDLKYSILTTVTGPAVGHAEPQSRTERSPVDEFVFSRTLPEGYGDSRKPLFVAYANGKKSKGESVLKDAYAIFSEWCLVKGHRRPNFTVFEVGVRAKHTGGVVVYGQDPEREGSKYPQEEWKLSDFTYAFTSDAGKGRKGIDNPTLDQLVGHWAFEKLLAEDLKAQRDAWVRLLERADAYEHYKRLARPFYLPGYRPVPKPSDFHPRCGWVIECRLHLTARSRVPADLEVWRSAIVVRRNLSESEILLTNRTFAQAEASVEEFVLKVPYEKKGSRYVLVQELYERYFEHCSSAGLVRKNLSSFVEELNKIYPHGRKDPYDPTISEVIVGGNKYPAVSTLCSSPPYHPTYDLYANEAALDTVIADLRKVSDAAILVVSEDLDLDGLVDGYVGRGVPSVWRQATARLREAHLVDGRLKWC